MYECICMYVYVKVKEDMFGSVCNAVFTINFLCYQPGGLVPMEFLQVPPGIYKSPIPRQFFTRFRSTTEINLNKTFICSHIYYDVNVLYINIILS